MLCGVAWDCEWEILVRVIWTKNNFAGAEGKF
jgi:hypothetical protein